MSADVDRPFSLISGGPFHSLLSRFGWIGPDRLPTRGAARALAVIAWTPPALLAAGQALLEDRAASWGFFRDWTVYTRFLIAIWVFVATERYADGRVGLLVKQFRAAKLLREEDRPALDRALDRADRRTGSRVAEAACLIAAFVFSGLTARFAIDLAGTSWEGTDAAGAVELSWAGFASRYVSTPLFLFLVLRWCWRFLVWARLLRRISRLPLQLVPLHPDRSAGLGFLAIYPSVFSGLVFALSCVMSSSFVKDLALQRHAPSTVWIAVAVWLGFCLVVFLGPLIVFVPKLYEERERAELEYGRLVAEHHSEFHRRWIGELAEREGRTGAQLLGSADPSSLADLTVGIEVAREMRIFPVDLEAVKRLLLAAGLPMLAVVGTQISLLELLGHIAEGFLGG